MFIHLLSHIIIHVIESYLPFKHMQSMFAHDLNALLETVYMRKIVPPGRGVLS